MGGSSGSIERLFCNIRKRSTTLDYCRSCNLVTAETTRNIITNTKGLFTAQGFYTAYQDLEKARESFRDENFDNTLTRSIACFESTMRICHDKLEIELPNKKQITGLWKSTREILNFDGLDSSGKTVNLINSLSGVIMNLGALRNTLGDAHGKGLYPSDVSESIAELALNASATLSTIVIRRFNQIKEGKNE